MVQEFQVKRTRLEEHRVIEAPQSELNPGQVRLKIDLFSMTANNITYGVVGDMLGYWKFFPAANSEDGEWGILPVWAFANVVESRYDEMAVGERLFGYFPPATELVMAPNNITDRTVFDGASHRQELPPLYNRYQRLGADPSYDPSKDVSRVLLGPLHLTSFCLFDQLSENGFYDAEQVIIVSASSKTSIGLAYALHSVTDTPEVVGLTSTRNTVFVEGCGLYDKTVAYDDIMDSLATKRSVVVDMAGNAELRGRLMGHLGPNLSYYISVGATHWDAVRSIGSMSSGSSDKLENFFAPGYVMKRIDEIGPVEWDRRAGQFMAACAERTFDWITVEEVSGLSGLQEIYDDVARGFFPPDRGLIIRM